MDTINQTIGGTISTIPVGGTISFDIVGRIMGTPPASIVNTAQATYFDVSGVSVTVQDDAVIGAAGICSAPEILGSTVLNDGETELQVTCAG